jgi:hypothetical protein
MRFKLITLAILSTLMLTSCGSSSTQTSYDELDLIKYQSCMDLYLAGLDKFNFSRFQSEQYAQQAEDQCRSLRPAKK